MCLKPYHIKYQTFDGSWRESDVPCGKCPECVRRAQSDLMILVHRQLEASTGSSWFVTLTYKDAALPLSLTFSVYEDLRLHDSAALIDPLETFNYRKDGKLLRRSKPVRLARSPLKTFSKFDKIASSLDDWNPTRSSLAAREAAVLAEYSRRYRWNGHDGRTHNVVKPGVVMELSRRWFSNKDGVPAIIIATVTTSVDRQDPQLWLKAARVAYERRFGRKLPHNMSYTIIQEYGPRGHRPHYHAIFTNIEESDLVWILKRWCVRYTGFREPRRYSGSGVVYDRIDRCTSSGGNGFACAGKYLGAYFKKTDDVQEPTMLAGLAVRPRRCSSIGFGIGKDFEQLRSWLLGFDVVGQYDPSDLSCVDPEQVFELVQRRNKIFLPLAPCKAVELAVPSYLRNKIFKNVKTKVSQRKVLDRFSPSSFRSYCEGSGFVHKPYRYEAVCVSYPCSSELSQGLADLAAFRSDLLYTESLLQFAGVPYDPSAPGSSFALTDVPGSVVVQFNSMLATAKSSRADDIRLALHDKYKKSSF